MKESKTVEQKVAETILDAPKVIRIGGVTYTVTPPTVGTVILVSSEIAKLPETTDIDMNDGVGMMRWSLVNAKDCIPLARILAMMILGAKKALEKIPSDRKKGLFTKEAPDADKTQADALSETIMDELSPYELSGKISELLPYMQLPGFFAVTTFLKEIPSVTKPTREVVKATQSGLQLTDS
jgi:hypothetical protein